MAGASYRRFKLRVRVRDTFSLEVEAESAYLGCMDIVAHDTLGSPVEQDLELAPFGAPLHIAVAPGSLDHDHTVVREPDEDDERYQSRCELLAALLAYAKQG